MCLHNYIRQQITHMCSLCSYGINYICYINQCKSINYTIVQKYVIDVLIFFKIIHRSISLINIKDKGVVLVVIAIHFKYNFVDHFYTADEKLHKWQSTYKLVGKSMIREQKMSKTYRTQATDNYKTYELFPPQVTAGLSKRVLTKTSTKSY